MGAADARFQHSSAPYRNAALLAKIVNPPCRSESTDPPEFDIDDAAGTESNRSERLLFGVNALVQANWRDESLLKFHVCIQIVPAQRLFDHHQVEIIQLFQERR